jgi:hypothetical protein
MNKEKLMKIIEIIEDSNSTSGYSVIKSEIDGWVKSGKGNSFLSVICDACGCGLFDIILAYNESLIAKRNMKKTS